MTQTEWQTLSFNVDPETADEFQRAIIALQAEGHLSPDANRSTVLRRFVREFLEDPADVVETIGAQ